MNKNLMSTLKLTMLCALVSSISANAWGVTNLQTCFSPQGNCDQVIVDYIGTAHKSIDIAIYNLSLRSFRAALLKAKSTGVTIRLVVDREQAQQAGSLIDTMIQDGFNIRFGDQKGVMHNKFTIVDGQWVETGSYNYSMAASGYNAENQIYLNDSKVVQDYQNEFESIWKTGITP